MSKKKNELVNVLAQALGINKIHPCLTPLLPKLPTQIPCRVGTGSQKSAKQFYFNQLMPRQPRAVSPPSTLLVPQGSGSVLPQLTWLLRQKCLTSQEQLLLDLHIQIFGPNFHVKYILANAHDTVHQAGILDQDGFDQYCSEIVQKVATLQQRTLCIFVPTLLNTEFEELKEQL